MLNEFKNFAIRGNLLDLAVAFVMGVAFAALVTSFVDDILMQIVAAIFGEQNFSALSFTLNGSEIRYGAFLTALIIFLQVALALFLIVKAVERMRRESDDEGIVEPGEEVALLREIRDALVAGRTPQPRQPILGPLRELDEVAYLRFASVYSSFTSLEDFESAISTLRRERPAGEGDDHGAVEDQER